MEPRDRKNWENQWGEAFKGASETPSPLVWKSIEASLASGSTPGKAWWAWVAAAFLGGVITTASLFVMMDEPEVNRLALDAKGEAIVPSNSSPNISIDRYEPSDIKPNRLSFDAQTSSNKLMAVKRKPNSLSRVSAIGPIEEGESRATLLAFNENDIQLNELKSLRPDLLPTESMASAEVKGVFIFDPSKFKPKEFGNKKDWLAGLALSSGAFQQGANGQAPTNMSTISSSPKSQGFVNYSDMAVSSSLGMNVGRRVSNRWVVSGGLGYQLTTNESTSNMILVNENDKGDRNVVGELSSSGFGFSDPAEGYRLESGADTYKMQNSYQFVSVPVSVGYFLIDKKWKLNLNAGLNTDIFYQYSSKAESGDLQDYVVKPADDPNWKYFNMSVAGGLELSRVMADNYVVALAPGYRHALSEFGVSGNNQLQPNVFHVTLKFNYIF